MANPFFRSNPAIYRSAAVPFRFLIMVLQKLWPPPVLLPYNGNTNDGIQCCTGGGPYDCLHPASTAKSASGKQHDLSMQPYSRRKPASTAGRGAIKLHNSGLLCWPISSSNILLNFGDKSTAPHLFIL